MDYRPLPEDRREEFLDFLHYAFSLEDGPQDEHDVDHDQPGEPRALFDGDEMLCVCHHYWLRTRLRGHTLEMPGLSAVASPPEHRRRGHVTRMLADSLAEYRDRGDFLTALWAFEHPFYGRQGWGLANKYVRYECDPDALAFAREAVRSGDYAAGEFRPAEADDHERLDSVLAADGEGYELAVDRSEQWWRKKVFDSWRTDPYVYAWEKAGEVRGYVVYRVHDEDDGKRLHASELAAVDREARLNLLRFLADHDSQVETVSIYDRDDTGLLDAVDDPADVECEVKPGPMVRLVDVPAAIEALTYPDAPDCEFTLSVSDPLVDWNDRAFRVGVRNGAATCEPVAEARRIGEADSDRADSEGRTGPDERTSPERRTGADVQTGVGTLAQVYVGYHPVADAETFGDLEIRSSEARDALAAMFPERDVFLRETF